jgi:hypothetical protein
MDIARIDVARMVGVISLTWHLMKELPVKWIDLTGL